MGKGAESRSALRTPCPIGVTDTFTEGELEPGKEPVRSLDPDHLWFVHGKAYDLNAFVARHPGKPLLLCVASVPITVQLSIGACACWVWTVKAGSAHTRVRLGDTTSRRQLLLLSLMIRPSFKRWCLRAPRRLNQSCSVSHRLRGLITSGLIVVWSSPAGGADAILTGIGRDCTALFESYHPFTDKPKHVLAKYQVP
jgi:hypothetical protein